MASTPGKEGTRSRVTQRVRDITREMLKVYKKKAEDDNIRFDPATFDAEVFEPNELTFFNKNISTQSCSVYVGDCNSIATLMMLFNFIMQLLKFIDDACNDPGSFNAELRIRKINSRMAKYHQTGICSTGRQNA